MISIVEFVAREFPHIDLSNDQQQALVRIHDWLTGHKAKKQFVLAGYAGTGKSFLIKLINAYLDRNGVKGINISYTGKAVDVLRNLDPAFPCQTIHATIYQPREVLVNNKPFTIWERRRKIDYDFIIADEVSMIGQSIYDDLRGYGKPMLLVGDSFQLEPVEAGQFSLLRAPDFEMSEIVRQAQGSPIIGMSALLRYNKPVPKLNVPGFYHGPKTAKIDALIAQAKTNPEIQIVVATNWERKLYNERVCGQNCKPFEVGDRIINLENNYDYGIFNGQQGFVSKIFEYDQNKRLYLAELDFFGADQPVVAPCFDTDGLTGPQLSEAEKKKALKLAYSYAVTCHKAQGSQWQTVIVINPKNPHPAWHMNRWRYTGITRAVSQCYFVY